MKVLVYTSIWSLAFRRNMIKDIPEVNLLSELIDRKQIVMIGIIRQEILSGIKRHEQFLLLRDMLRVFKDESLASEDFEKAAEFFNVCRSRGVQGSNYDFLICAVAVNHKYKIFTSDKDFELYSKHLPIELL
ncbi:MAG: type II toxin-antitoxin system VapC family toxin [Ignavibacteriaceae bacterium]